VSEQMIEVDYGARSGASRVIGVVDDRDITVKDRIGYIGGSDAAAIVGVSAWKTPYQVYLEKVGEKAPDDLSGNERVYWGTVLEELVADEYAKRTESKIRRVNRLVRHSKYLFLGAHIDRDILNTDRILEVKTAGSGRDWGEAGTDEIPDHYLPQVLHYMLVTGAVACDVAVLIAGSDFRIYTVERNEEMIAYLLEQELEFWARVEERDPPEATSPDDAKLAYPLAHEGTVIAERPDYQSAYELTRINTQIKGLEANADVHKARLMARMGESGDTLVYGTKKIATWKSQAGRTSVDSKLLKANYPEAYEQCKKEGKPHRVFRLSKMEE